MHRGRDVRTRFLFFSFFRFSLSFAFFLFLKLSCFGLSLSFLSLSLSLGLGPSPILTLLYVSYELILTHPSFLPPPSRVSFIHVFLSPPLPLSPPPRSLIPYYTKPTNTRENETSMNTRRSRRDGGCAFCFSFVPLRACLLFGRWEGEEKRR